VKLAIGVGGRLGVAVLLLVANFCINSGAARVLLMVATHCAVYQFGMAVAGQPQKTVSITDYATSLVRQRKLAAVPAQAPPFAPPLSVMPASAYSDHA
jgi:uncharacterized membrane protein